MGAGVRQLRRDRSPNPTGLLWRSMIGQAARAALYFSASEPHLLQKGGATMRGCNGIR